MIVGIERFKSLLNYDEKTGIFTWKVDRSPRVKAGNIAGSLDKDGYIKIRVDNKIFCAHRIAFGFICGEFPANGIDVDHINGNRADNKKLNLRLATRSQNNFNSGMRVNNTTGFKGVNYLKKYKKYAAEARVNNVKYRLGYFDTPEEASAIYQNFIKKMHGEYLHVSSN